MRASLRIVLIILILTLLLLLVVVPGVSWAQATELDSAVQLFAESILAALPAGSSVDLNFDNKSSLPVELVDDLGHRLRVMLQEHSLRVVGPANASASVQVTFADLPDGRLWVAEIRRAAESAVIFFPVPRDRSTVNGAAASTLVLLPELLLEQQNPILDFAYFTSDSSKDPQLLVLEPERILHYERAASKWAEKQILLISHTQPWPRDLRGRIGVWKDRFGADLPGVACWGKVVPTFKGECQPSDAPWALHSWDDYFETLKLQPGRNVFRAGDSQRLPPYFTQAILPGDGATVSLVAELDGTAKLYGSTTGVLGTFQGWGSDLAGLSTECGNRRQVLTTLGGDWTVRDTLQAFEILGNRAVALGNSIRFEGPILALWPSNPGGTAEAVVWNLKTRKYEAYRITVTCGK